ncbi:hypothetical protein NPIL_433761 [Nephila pilipes]|uniref:Uncharacterized protein n=1 Tax=Nephila pilipes TaxID=299642 RepID=A0A8X6JUT3_NEPPI|nr:hypothetical protein NPIL_433761 [Nephila pilipes]
MCVCDKLAKQLKQYLTVIHSDHYGSRNLKNPTPSLPINYPNKIYPSLVCMAVASASFEFRNGFQANRTKTVRSQELFHLSNPKRWQFFLMCPPPYHFDIRFPRLSRHQNNQMNPRKEYLRDRMFRIRSVHKLFFTLPLPAGFVLGR